MIRLLVVLLISTNVLAAKKLSEYSTKKLKNDLAKYDTKLSQLKAEINSLDKKIGVKNGKYISKLEKIKSIENMMMSLDEQIVENIDIIGKKKASSKQLLERLYINNLDQDEDGEFLYKKAMYTKLLKREKKDLDLSLQRNLEFKKSIKSLRTNLAQIKEDEKTLYQVILELENEKKRIAEMYLDSEQKKKLLEKKIEKSHLNKKLQKLKKSKKIATDMKFTSPLDRFIDYKAGKKGITYTFKTVMPVKSAGAGTVVYTGELSRYGNVVMVDHGKNIKSVFLGDLVVKVKKGDTLNAGDVLGYTNKSKKDEDRNLYFEVRKNNKAQNTVLWLDKKSIVKI